jgi:hypothetical protein
VWSSISGVETRDVDAEMGSRCLDREVEHDPYAVVAVDVRLEQLAARVGGRWTIFGALTSIDAANYLAIVAKQRMLKGKRGVRRLRRSL